jgi:hypothetical protein
MQSSWGISWQVSWGSMMLLSTEEFNTIDTKDREKLDVCQQISSYKDQDLAAWVALMVNLINAGTLHVQCEHRPCGIFHSKKWFRPEFANKFGVN